MYNYITSKKNPSFLKALRIAFISTVALLFFSSNTFATEPLFSDEPNWQFDLNLDFISVGDVNGDGFTDFIAGSPDYDNGASEPSEGAAFVFYGSVDGKPSSPSLRLKVDAIAHEDVAITTLYFRTVDFGKTIKPAGDINGDGYDDVIVGDPRFLVPGSNYMEQLSGAVFIYYGSINGLLDAPEKIIPGADRFSNFGQVFNSAGDINADGYDDILISDSNKYVTAYFGSATGRSSSFWTLQGTQFRNVGSAGDVNNDGFGDVVVGQAVGNGYIFLGSASGLSDTWDWYKDGGSNQRTERAGDVNNDGYDDIIFGDSIYLGVATGVSITPEITMAGQGYPVGDVNGDNFDDVVASEYIYLGKSSNISLTTTAPNGKWAGDINRDGYDDIIEGNSVFYGRDYDSNTVSDSDSDGIPNSEDGNPLVPNKAPMLFGTSSNSVIENENYSFIPNMTDDGDTETITFYISNMPVWASFDSLTGGLTGTPTHNNVGTTADIVIYVSDGYLESSLPSFSIEVININDAPTLATPIPSQTINTGSNTNINISEYFTDADENDVLTFTATSLPQSLTMTSGGLITGTTSNVGSFIIAITASDAFGLTAEGTFTLNVQQVTPEDSGGSGGSFSFGLLFLLAIFSRFKRR